MTWFSRLSVFHKIMLILGVYAVSSAINFTIGIKGVNDTKSYIVNLEERIYESVQLATQNSFLLQRADEMFTQSVTAGDPEMQTLGEETVGNLLSNIDRLLTIDAANKDILSQIKVSAAEYLSVSSKLLNNLLSDNPDFSQLQSLGSQKSDLLSETNALLKQHKANVDIQFSSAIDGALSSSSHTLNMVTVTNVAFLILLSVLIFYIGRLFSNTVNSMKNSLAGLADGSGDLNTRLKVQTEDELGVMTRNFNAFMDRLNDIIRKVKEVAPEVGDAANAMSGSTNHVRSVTENMSHKASEATYAMNEMAKSIEEVSQSASEASGVMQETRDESAESLKIVESTINNSRELNSQILEASERVERLVRDTGDVSTILDVISAIAEQTNLLALNAAIEAARAGEQGRGFAVVADEVRALASRTASATTEIRDVLDRLESAANETVQSMTLAKTQSEQNEQNAEQTGKHISQIKSRVESVSSMGLTIAAATEEQTAVVRDTHTSISAMNDTVSEIQRSFTELARLAENLQGAAGHLQDSTSKFRI
ncbi:MAG: methyl-accepting chemotaxis protein [Thalassolituus sp.]|jgi:methyl-accepting chemotaxis protein|uniref:methyl-accepting chemotaxis protein n=1 Tax=Thalassolituus sp. TaxID=2030822 RepID=UPI0027D6B1D6|nr:methyl-accepting chemotaxis protein [Thalassolituus sp.]MDQ4422585.1 methyl-accepting chemotaxis protein [Thalassolituus sp.]MDQ4424987.1 methyl-accepting chemotaxis protein [Thalassolituus sp.]